MLRFVAVSGKLLEAQPLNDQLRVVQLLEAQQLTSRLLIAQRLNAAQLLTA
jgi:hypothetical protein